MKFLNKVTPALLITFLILAAIAASPVAAQTVPKPSVPEFILQIADHSYDVPDAINTYTDPYTGKATTQTQPGYHVINKTIEVKIANQHFTSYTDSGGNKVGLYYNVSVRPHYGGNWTYYPISYTQGYPASDSEYTSLNFVFGAYANGGYAHGRYADSVSPSIGYVAPGGEVDFSVQAQIGYYKGWDPFHDSDLGFVGESSGWSDIQTIKIPEDITAPYATWPTTAPTTTSAPIKPVTNSDSTALSPSAFSVTIIIVVLVSITLSILLARRHRKTKKLTINHPQL